MIFSVLVEYKVRIDGTIYRVQTRLYSYIGGTYSKAYEATPANDLPALRRQNEFK